MKNNFSLEAGQGASTATSRSTKAEEKKKKISSRLPGRSSSSTSASRTKKVRWSLLPHDILVCIVERLLSPDGTDFLRFGAVCRAWRSAANDKSIPPPRKNMPWLMLAEHSVPGQRNIRHFYSPSEDKIYEFPLPEARGRACYGLVDGWVATVGKDEKMHLLNPFTKERIQLPPLQAFNASSYQGRDWSPEHKRTYFVRKVCTSTCPSLNNKDRNCIVLAFYGAGQKLAFTRLCDQAWTPISCKWWPYSDAVYYKDRFYAMGVRAVVVALDIRRRRVEKVASRPENWFGNFERYLVESSGDLLQVVRQRNYDSPYETWSFYVFKLLNMETGEWEELDSLGDQSLFLGQNYSISVAASELSGCQPDCVYFTDDNILFYDDALRGGHDMGVYSMESDSIERHYKGQSLSDYSPPLWVAPYVWWKKR